MIPNPNEKNKREGKSQTSLAHKHRCKIPKQSIRKPNTATYKLGLSQGTQGLIQHINRLKKS